MWAVDPFYLGLAAVVYALVCIPSAVRWTIVVAAMGHRFAFRKALQIVLIGYFFNLTLISSIGGDSVRMWEAHRAGLPTEVAVKSVIIERLLQAIAHLLLVLIGIPFLFYRQTGTSIEVIAVFILATSVMGIAGILLLDRLPLAFQQFRLVKLVIGLSGDIRGILATPRRAVSTVALGLINQIGTLAVVSLLALGLHLPISFLDCLIVVPVATLAMALPISIAGWGVRESAFVFGFGLLLLPAQDALALSALFGILTMAVRLPGALVWLLTSRARGSNPH